MSFQPTFDRVLVERDSKDSKSRGGIYIPDTAQEKASKGTVRAVGPGRWFADGTRQAVSVKVGDRVLFQPYDGVEFKIGEANNNLIILNETNILGVLN